MSFSDLNCYGLTCKNVLPALGGEHFSKKKLKKKGRVVEYCGKIMVWGIKVDLTSIVSTIRFVYV